MEARTRGAFRSEPNALLALVILVALVVVATRCYHFIWEWELVDALDMTIITITTTGFRVVQNPDARRQDLHPVRAGGGVRFRRVRGRERRGGYHRDPA